MENEMETGLCSGLGVMVVSPNRGPPKMIVLIVEPLIWGNPKPHIFLYKP